MVSAPGLRIMTCMCLTQKQHILNDGLRVNQYLLSPLLKNYSGLLPKLSIFSFSLVHLRTSIKVGRYMRWYMRSLKETRQEILPEKYLSKNASYICVHPLTPPLSVQKFSCELAKNIVP